MNHLDDLEKMIVESEDVLSIMRHAERRVPRQLRAFWNAPIRRVIAALGRKFEEVHQCEFVAPENPAMTLAVDIDEITNDWMYDCLVCNSFEVKTTVDLVMLLEPKWTTREVINFFWARFPEYRLY